MRVPGAGRRRSLARVEAELTETRARLQQLVELMDERRLDAASRWERLFHELEMDRDRAEIDWEVRRLEQDRQSHARARLAEVRAGADYAHAFSDSDPLVTVRIASYRRTRELVDVAVRSVLRQTYGNLELVIVNDGPNDETRAALEAVGDPRIRYEELAERHQYPRHPHLRWMVAGSPGMNRGVELARGTWIAPLDDDDEFEPDHIEKLLRLALAQRAELAYGAVRRVEMATRVEHRVFSSPPAISQFSFQGALYLRLLDFMPYDTESWRLREPGDWNLIRRMSDIGVRFASTPDYVSTMYSVDYSAKTEQ